MYAPTKADDEMAGCHVEKPEDERFTRIPEHDKRVSRGDDFAGDAWLDNLTGEIVLTVVGHDRNAPGAIQFIPNQ